LVLCPSPLLSPGQSVQPLLNLADRAFGCKHEGSDRGSILQSRAGNLGGVDYAGLDHILVLLGRRVEATVNVVMSPDLFHHDSAFDAGVLHDLPKGLLARALYNVHANLLVALELQLL
jgi:hypothetical protein